MERDFLIEAYYAQENDENESLAHHGIKGQHWGIRRYQNPDGSLTPEGRRHWGIGDAIRGAKTNVQKYVKSKKAAALRNKKNAILARGDVNEILKNKHMFTTKELDKAISRTQRMAMLKAMSPEEKAAREKEIKAQQNTARGKEMVDRTLYHAGQLIQMAPAMIQCYAIVKGLFGGSGGSGGGNPPTPPTPNPPSGGSGGGNPPSGGSGGSGGHGNPPNPPSGGSGGHGNNGGSGGHSDITQSIIDAAPLISGGLAGAHDVSINSLTDSIIISDNAGAQIFGQSSGIGPPGYNLDALFD